jgi:Protein of unknown function (DUF3667)
MINCKNCGSEVEQKYCPNCGHAIQLKRIDGSYIWHEIEHILHFERGILYTIKGLLINPGKSVKHFITENRTRLVKPIIFIIITSALYSLSQHYFHVDNAFVKFNLKEGGQATNIKEWFDKYLGYLNIIIGIFIAFWVKVFFKKYEYNFFEIQILLCFLVGIQMLFFALMTAIQGLTHMFILDIAGLIGTIYITWGIANFFDKSKGINYIKAIGSYLLGLVSFLLLALIISMIFMKKGISISV